MPHHAPFQLHSVLPAAVAHARLARTSSASEVHLNRRAALGVPNHTANPAPKKNRTFRPVGARPIQLKSLSVDDFDRRDPGPVSDAVSSDPPMRTGTPTDPSPVPTMPLPTSPRSLYRNLLFVTSNPSFSLPKAIDYYFDWPKALRSTKSFNLLISLALRSAAFASVGRLFGAMRAESVPPNMETWKLHVRWFVRIGRWNEGWERVLEITGHQQNVSAKLPNKPIPLPLWLELFGSQKRGALRRWVVADRKPNAETFSRASSHTNSEQLRLDGGAVNAENVSSILRKRHIPRPHQRSRAVELSRYRALMQVSPLLAASDEVQILPRTILIITQTMHRVGQRKLAFSTTLAYLESLPPHLRRCDRRRVLDLVNVHLSMVAQHGKPGLKQHFAQRRILWKFLRARPDLTPSSTTLFLLVAPLRGCRRSGTLAVQCLRLFEKRWGPRVQSRSVRRRIASLALKEGRLDIVGDMLRLESRCSVFDDAFPRNVLPTRRRPWRTLFGQRGAENRRWRLIEDTYRRRLMSRSQS